ncbi:anthrone oxygenase family protein [Micromonospora coxensis]|uniref:Uncharacterized membrane protein n=1 Tax=Micromonospora coxensis TaxID=356852 RepID=A0A1C5IVH7_9ACTN|nr:anthrone oxygenase family protein [Micromonospora coxensis]SCG62332.1 Uncharacterized membrane protein [Micromonospora coxensis]
MRTLSLAAATVATGLMAGLFFAYACSVVPGLAAVDDRTFVGTMQSINRRILNGWFLAAFLGAVLLIGLAVALHVTVDGRVLAWTVAALVSYGATLLITMRCNVPLNDRLDAAGPVDRIADLRALRDGFEASWARWNLARTVTTVVAFACLVAALASGRS